MKVRIRFRKEGVMRFIGHLDVMRYFQKLLRRADIPIAYSTGMSPHQIMSFAMPLSMGLESDAEYVDIEITHWMASKEAVNRMNAQNVEGIEIISFKELPDNALNAMASISAADYEIKIKDGKKPSFSCRAVIDELLKQDKIEILKQTKKNENLVDIKPGIYSVSGDDECIKMCLSCGSVLNVKPEFVMGMVFDKMGETLPEFALNIRRKEIYTGLPGSFVSLNDIGTDIL